MQLTLYEWRRPLWLFWRRWIWLLSLGDADQPQNEVFTNAEKPSAAPLHNVHRQGDNDYERDDQEEVKIEESFIHDSERGL